MAPHNAFDIEPNPESAGPPERRGASTPDHAFERHYAYDPIGNRTASSAGGRQARICAP